jgi:hypothetical protein
VFFITYLLLAYFVNRLSARDRLWHGRNYPNTSFRIAHGLCQTLDMRRGELCHRASALTSKALAETSGLLVRIENGFTFSRRVLYRDSGGHNIIL